MIRITASEFIKSAVKPDHYPPAQYAEIAFVGKSNVGKSSLINALLNRKALAKVSRQPGKTRLLNFFQVRFKSGEQDGFFTAVDLPGYGFAKVSEQEKESWRVMIESYFRIRQELRGVFVLVDIRHKADVKDMAMLDMLRSLGIHFAIAATKSDKIAQAKVGIALQKLAKGLQLQDEKIMPFSALKKTGQTRILNWIEELIL
ncbi:MAG: ribosome biogenesis GTP-binding protein YihA/YsxC [Candidatus Cloacimonetes bacterium]|nr:ribosome biogenesis GTP-binding protein YihA/YsxC [Candidatus Cloacimonadota bacterium]